MPTPGSHAYDLKRSRLRSRLEDEGIPDQRADEKAADMMKRDVGAENPAARSDRAAGPLGEQGGGGDPGAVMELRSPAFSDSTLLPARCAHDADNVSPALEWSPVPDGAAELVLLCEDRDTPKNFIHWLVSGIDPGVSAIDEGEKIPGSTSWPNGFGEYGYGGPQPPIGDEPHRYYFRLFALGRPLALPPDSSSDEIRRAVEEDHLAVGTLVGLFAR
jgi:Raf kinase inhibitor-like YbhB/YbcL family protein